MLVEQGRIRLTDRVATFIPGFERYGKARHHHPPPADARVGPAAGRRSRRSCGSATETRDRSCAIEEVPTAPPGERFVYSDINFFLLGDIVRRVSGQPLDEFAQDADLQAARHEGHDVQSARVADAADRADRELHAATAGRATGPDMQMLRGVVHDPTARRMGGVAGHAGLFSTAADLAIFSRMLLNGGTLPRRPRAVAADGREDDDARRRAGLEPNLRALGWDVDSIVLVEPRRAAADRIVRPHRVHRHVALDRSGDRDVRRVPVEPRASRRQGRRHAAAGAGRDHRRVGARPRRRDGADPRLYRAATSAAGAVGARRARGRRRRSCRPRRAARRGLRAAAGQARRPRHQPHRPRPRRRDRDRPAVRGQGRQARRAVQPGARHPRHRSTRRCRRRRTRRPGCRSTRSTARPAGRPPRCSTDSTRSSSTCRTSARGSTPTSRRWRTCMEEAAKQQLPVVRARSAQSDQRLPDRGPGARQGR